MQIDNIGSDGESPRDQDVNNNSCINQKPRRILSGEDFFELIIRPYMDNARDQPSMERQV